MNPEDKVLLERALRLSEENNKILKRLDRTRRWAVIWGFIKVLIIIVPLIAGYIYLQPFIKDMLSNFQAITDLL